MDEIGLNVLLLGESGGGWSYLQKQLQKRNCRCRFARSPTDVLSGAAARKYNLILSSMPAAQIDAFIDDLGDERSNVFYCHPVEDDCWWLPVVRQGRRCFGAPGVRGREFFLVIDQMIRDTGEPLNSSHRMEAKLSFG